MEGDWKPLWVVDFPMFEWDEGTSRWQALHHPFTAPKTDHVGLLDSAPGDCLSRAYDMVLNGTEVGGGSIRIHRDEISRRCSTCSASRKTRAGEIRLPADPR